MGLLDEIRASRVCPSKGEFLNTETPSLWVFVIVFIVVLIALYWIIKPCWEWYHKLDKPCWGDSYVVLGAITLVALGALCLTAYQAMTNPVTFEITNWSRILVIVLLLAIIFWAVMFFRYESVDNGLFISGLIGLGAIVLMFYAWKGDRATKLSAGIFLLWALLLVYLMYAIKSRS